MSEQMWMERAQSAEARIVTTKESYEAAIERVKQFKANFGVKERSDGSIDIDFDKLVENHGPEACLDLRKAIDARWAISGIAGEKPRIRLTA